MEGNPETCVGRSCALACKECQRDSWRKRLALMIINLKPEDQNTSGELATRMFANRAEMRVHGQNWNARFAMDSGHNGVSCHKNEQSSGEKTGNIEQLQQSREKSTDGIDRGV